MSPTAILDGYETHAEGSNFATGIGKTMEQSVTDLTFDLQRDEQARRKLHLEKQRTSGGGADPLKDWNMGDHRSLMYLRRVMLAE